MSRQHPTKPVAAVGVVVTHQEKVLLVRRSQAPRKGIWTLPGGAIELGETAKEAIHREIQEECNISVQIEKVLDVVDIIERDASGQVQYHYAIIEFWATYQSGELRAASDAAEARWVTAAELDQYALSKDALRLIQSSLVRKFP